MSLTNYTLDQEFDILATWFRVGETSEMGVKGKLHYSNESIVLDLYDSFSNQPAGDTQTIDQLYGLSTTGAFLIVNDCSPISEDATTFGFAVESYAVATFYLLDARRDLPVTSVFSQVTSLRISLDHLHNWINRSSLNVFIKLDQGKPKSYLITSQELIVSAGVAHSRKREQKGIVLEENYFLELIEQNHKPKSFASFFEEALLIKKLIEFLSHSPLPFTSVEFTFPQGQGRYFFKQNERPLEQLPENTLTLDQIEKEFSSVLNRWFLKEDAFALIIDNYLNDLSRDYYIETKLVNSIRNLEMHYRNFMRDSHYIEERRKSLQADQQLLLEFVERAVSKKHQQHFIRNILYIGEESLRAKLNNLIRNLPKPLFTKCVQQADKNPSDSRNSFINTLIETRNFYTHGDEAENYPNRLIGQEDFLRYNEKLKLFQRYYIYKELGLSEEVILSVLLPEAATFE